MDAFQQVIIDSGLTQTEVDDMTREAFRAAFETREFATLANSAAAFFVGPPSLRYYAR